MDDPTHRKYVAWLVTTLNEELGITDEVFCDDTGLNLGRILRCETCLNGITLSKLRLYYNMSAREFYEREDEFLNNHLHAFKI